MLVEVNEAGGPKIARKWCTKCGVQMEGLFQESDRVSHLSACPPDDGMDRIRIGDLVKDPQGHYGIVMELSEELVVFFGNGLPCIERADNLERIFLPNSTAPCNFLEVLVPLRSGLRVRIQREAENEDPT